MFGRQTMAEAIDSMEQLHALVERCYEEMSTRVRALEVLDIQNGGDANWTSVDDTESIATIRLHPPDARYEATTDRQTVHFDFLHDLQKSRVYRRGHALRGSVFSALTNSACSVGWSLLSEMSLSEVSNISVINLPITDGEIFNPQRFSLIRSSANQSPQVILRSFRAVGWHLPRQKSRLLSRHALPPDIAQLKVMMSIPNWWSTTKRKRL